ncbi:alpha/beta fold hydrolase [Actinomycetospora chiangmaiensis]|uniref:alpha/beta fold hydrolase n=1 Tax=Actinomycetospora chiangmaiensis TaxID=402650 RepID=UPI000526A690|nr:alpha/beta hydrolase [Actinomycetospora chiangmaiensis]
MAADGRRLAARLSVSHGSGSGTVFWHHGTLRDGTPPRPFVTAAHRLGLRWISVARPGHGRSSPRPGRSVAAVARDVAAVADHLGVDRFAVVGHSAGAAHALACAALLPGRVPVAVAIGAYAPRDVAGLDWYAHLDPAATLALRAAEQGREHKLAFEREHPDLRWLLPDVDVEALEQGWFIDEDTTGDARAVARTDDHVALVSPWGFDPADVGCPALLVHGEGDTFVPATHARALGATMPQAEKWVSPVDGHFSILRRCDAALEWVRRRL